jgi:hypothetical protein
MYYEISSMISKFPKIKGLSLTPGSKPIPELVPNLGQTYRSKLSL